MEALKGADLLNARTHLMKLAIILEDIDLHLHFLQNGGKEVLIQYLHQSLVVTENEPCLSVMSSIAKTLLFIAHVNPTLKKELASDNSILMNLLRYLLHVQTNFLD